MTSPLTNSSRIIVSPQPNVSPTKVSPHLRPHFLKLLNADNTSNIFQVSDKIFKILSRDHRLTFKHIEAFLRNNEANTYLFARECPVNSIALLNGQQKQYIIALLSKNDFFGDEFKEISYNENQNRLENTGYQLRKQEIPKLELDKKIHHKLNHLFTLSLNIYSRKKELNNNIYSRKKELNNFIKQYVEDGSLTLEVIENHLRQCKSELCLYAALPSTDSRSALNGVRKKYLLSLIKINRLQPKQYQKNYNRLKDTGFLIPSLSEKKEEKEEEPISEQIKKLRITIPN
jgi:hypothetical protein